MSKFDFVISIASSEIDYDKFALGLSKELNQTVSKKEEKLEKYAPNNAYTSSFPLGSLRIGQSRASFETRLAYE